MVSKVWKSGGGGLADPAFVFAVEAEFAFEDFAAGVAGELGEEADVAGDFVAAKMFAAVGADGGGVEGLAFVEDDVGDDFFAVDGVGLADDGRFADGGMFVEDFFDDAGIDVHAVDDDHVFDAV